MKTDFSNRGAGSRAKAIIASSALAVFAVAVFAQAPAAFNVTNVSCKIVAERDVVYRAVGTMTNGTPVAQGQLRRGSNGLLYWALNAATTTNSPAQVSGDSTLATDDVLWRRVFPGRRSGLSIMSGSANVVALSVGAPAVLSKGYVLTSYGAVLLLQGDEVPQGAVYAISTNTAAVVYIDEW